MSGARIRAVRTFEAVSPLSQPISDATHEIPEIRFLIVEVELDSGVVGQGYLLAFHYSPRAIAGALADLAEFARGYPVHEMRRLARDYARETEYFGEVGLLRWAGACLDVALWDAWGRILGQPVWKLLGGSAARIPLYGSGGWLSYSDEQLVEEVREYRERGFRAVKIKVGSPEPGHDLHRLRLVRDAVGPELRIMMDANQGLDLPAAVQLSVAAEELGIHWFEEPLPRTDFDGYATLRARTSISLAMGEREYDTTGLRALIARNALDLWQPDLLRIGGVHAWRDSAALAAGHHIPVLPHYYKDYDVPLLCTIPNGYGAESFDWIDGLIDEPMRLENGLATPRDAPGWGFRFLPRHLRELQSPPSTLISPGS